MDFIREKHPPRVIATLALGGAQRSQVELQLQARRGGLSDVQFAGRLFITLEEASVEIVNEALGMEHIVIFKGERHLDLFSTQMPPQFLGISPAPCGYLSRMSVQLSAKSHLVTDKELRPVECFSWGCAPLELFPAGIFVPKDETLSLVLEFETVVSLVDGAHKLRVEPVVRLQPLAAS